MAAIDDPEALRAHQYATAGNLEARIALHRRFGTNPRGWPAWVMAQLEAVAPTGARVADIGCGSGALWRGARVPEGWRVLLADFAPGMLHAARAGVGTSGPFEHVLADARALGLSTGAFDLVIANHMLYHVPDRPAAIAELARVCRPGGHLVAATNGARHLAELRDIGRSFDPQLDFGSPTPVGFDLEGGAAQLEAAFETVTLRRYLDGLRITEAPPLVAYVMSMVAPGSEAAAARIRAPFLAHVAGLIEAAGGALEITKDSGLFVCHRKP